MIPEWSEAGVLPPIAPGEQGHSPRRAPYRTTMRSLIERMGTSSARREILGGLLDFRAGLHGAGLVLGFQWVNGSFVEDVERLQDRAPEDVDVVTFVELGDERQQGAMLTEHRELLDPVAAKATFHVDSYFVNLNDPLDGVSVRRVAYWYSMWAHRRRDRLWKGFLEIPLNQTDDDHARELLTQLRDGTVGLSADGGQS